MREDALKYEHGRALNPEEGRETLIAVNTLNQAKLLCFFMHRNESIVQNCHSNKTFMTAGRMGFIHVKESPS